MRGLRALRSLRGLGKRRGGVERVRFEFVPSQGGQKRVGGGATVRREVEKGRRLRDLQASGKFRRPAANRVANGVDISTATLRRPERRRRKNEQTPNAVRFHLGERVVERRRRVKIAPINSGRRRLLRRGVGGRVCRIGRFYGRRVDGERFAQAVEKAATLARERTDAVKADVLTQEQKPPPI